MIAKLSPSLSRNYSVFSLSVYSQIQYYKTMKRNRLKNKKINKNRKRKKRR